MANWQTLRQSLLLVSAAAALAGDLDVQRSVGRESDRPPNEDVYIYRQVPDVRISQASTGISVPLWGTRSGKPVLLALVFSRCAGVCSPFLHSLKSAISSAGGLGTDYRVVVLSFDPRDTPADMAAMAQRLGEEANPGWTFGVAPATEIQRLAEATGFRFKWDGGTRQYDHPAVLMVVDRGRMLRMLVGNTVVRARLAEVLQELRGKFVPSYPVAGDVAFRCFQYNPMTTRYYPDWGILLLALPGAMATLTAALIFITHSSKQS
jgi:protein SCO1